MAIFDGTYSWSGKKEDERDPIAWFPGAYDLKIVNLDEKKQGVTFLRPFLCIFTNTGHGHSISANPEKFAKRICVDFSLKLERVLWVEQLKDNPGNFEVIVFEKCGKLSENAFYQVQKRKPTCGEMALITKELAG